MGYTTLPAELREKILGHLLITPGHIVDPNEKSKPGEQRVLNPRVLRVSKLFYKEGAHLLYHRNTFHFTNRYALEAWLKSRKRSSYRNDTISHVIIHLKMPTEEYEDEFCETGPPGMRLTVAEALHQQWVFTLNRLHVAAPDLKTLVLWFETWAKSSDRAEDPAKAAQAILRCSIRNLTKLDVWGMLPDGYEDELLDALKPMLK